MAYLIPTLYVIVSYTFFLLPGLFDHVMELKILSILLPFIMGVVNLIIVLTVGRKWTRKTLLNCTLIIKYGLIPFYLIGGSITIGVTVAALFPLPLMALLGLVTIVFLIFGYGILLCCIYTKDLRCHIPKHQAEFSQEHLYFVHVNCIIGTVYKSPQYQFL